MFTSIISIIIIIMTTMCKWKIESKVTKKSHFQDREHWNEVIHMKLLRISVQLLTCKQITSHGLEIRSRVSILIEDMPRPQKSAAAGVFL